MKLRRDEEFRLLEVFKANAMGCRYWAEDLSQFDYLRAYGLAENGYGSQYGTIALTKSGLNHVFKVAEKLKESAYR